MVPYKDLNANAHVKEEPEILLKSIGSDGQLVKNVHEVFREVIEEDKIDARAIFLEIDGNKNHVI